MCLWPTGRTIGSKSSARVGSLSRFGLPQLIGPAALYADAEDVVYVPEHNGGHFRVLSPDGESLARWGSEENKSCHGVAGDSHGDVYFVQRIEAGQPRRLVKYVRR